MAFPDLFKLIKLRIEGYRDPLRNDPAIPPCFEAMFNPETFTLTYATRYDKTAAVGSPGQSAEFLSHEPTSLTLKLLLDGTNVGEMGVVAVFDKLQTVKERIEQFRKLAYDVNGDKHEPSYLKVLWGDSLTFECRLSKLSIAYSSFDREGNALRAELELTLLADEDLKRQLSAKSLSSPDVSHSRIAVAGDTLPLMTRRIYGSSAPYLNVARANKLDHFRTLNPGQEILFPPIAK